MPGPARTTDAARIRGDLSLDGRRALVTGAGRGIGRATALTLAAHGAAVAVNDLDPGAADDVASEISALGGTALAAPCSVADHGAVRDAVDEVQHRLGPIDILVSNAGIAASGRTLRSTPMAEVDEQFSVHVLGALALCQAVIPTMRAEGGGDIVVISSTAVRDLPPNSGAYTMAKSALEALAFTMAKEEARHGIRVNVVAPGFTNTDLGRLVHGRLVRARLVSPDERSVHLAPPEIVANAVLGCVGHDDPDHTGRRHATG